jgi:hypothetical protein
MQWKPFFDRDWRQEQVFSREAMTQWGPVVEVRSNAQGCREVWLRLDESEGSTLVRISASSMPYCVQRWRDFLDRCEKGRPYPPLRGIFRRFLGVTLVNDELLKDDQGRQLPQLSLSQTGWSSEKDEPRISLSVHKGRATFEEFRAWLALLDRVCQMLDETTTATFDKTE